MKAGQSVQLSCQWFLASSWLLRWWHSSSCWLSTWVMFRLAVYTRDIYLDVFVLHMWQVLIFIHWRFVHLFLFRRFWHHQEHARSAAAASVELFPRPVVINKVGVNSSCYCHFFSDQYKHNVLVLQVSTRGQHWASWICPTPCSTWHARRDFLLQASLHYEAVRRKRKDRSQI